MAGIPNVRRQSKHARKVFRLLFCCVGFCLSFILYLHLDQKGVYASILLELDYDQYTFNAPQSLSIKVNDTNQDFAIAKNSTSFCFPFNTKRWTDAGNTRLGNNNESSLADELIFESILDLESLLSNSARKSRSLLGQTLCHEKSRLLDFDTTQDVLDVSDKAIRTWSLRLTYLAVHIHQHIHALTEARHRSQLSKSCQSSMASRGIGKFDFECPSSKFLVVSMGKDGLGAVMRLGGVNALIAGIASNRTVLFMNNLNVGPKFLQKPWPLASCSRLDLQCFFMPMSPCVLTELDIINATELKRGEARSLFRTGKLPPNLEEERVVIMNSIQRPQRTPPTLRENLVKIINQHIIDPLRKENPKDTRLQLLINATNLTLQEAEITGDVYSYYGRSSIVNHALVFYAMRPNTMYSRKLETIVKNAFQKDFNPNLALGLPIRASDKCLAESECISFPQYMKLMGTTWEKHEQFFSDARNEAAIVKKINEKDVVASIIVTSESAQVQEEQQLYLKGDSVNESPIPFQFVNNDFDLHQGTGNPEMMTSRVTNATHDEFMLSAISSLKLQLHARYTVGNCCSNFHLLLFDFLEEGCGPAKDQEAECMQENEDPEFRLCCRWSKTEECDRKRNNNITTTS